MWECDLFDGGVCKPFPPPLVRGGVFEVGLETKYRDIADGNSTVRTEPSSQLSWKPSTAI